MIRPTTAIAAALLIAGCAQEPTAPSVVDTFCLSAKKRSWSIEDTAESAHEAQVWNRTIDIKCGAKQRTASK